MFASLIRNIFITGMAYAVISVVGLVLAPVLIATYGLAGYGQILLARVFLPSAAFGFLDLGIGENTTRVVATARADGSWETAGKALLLLLIIALVVSATTAGALAWFASNLAVWMSIEPDQRSSFVIVLLITAALLPVLFLSLIAEGVLKGFESFERLRACEIASALTYAGLAFGAVAGGYGPNSVSLALLAGLTLRFLLAAIWAVSLLRKHPLRLTKSTTEVRAELFAWSGTMLSNKVLGTLQTQAAAPLLGLLVGPAAVGLFDAIVRLPRFVKSIFSLLSATVLPLAARLRAAQDAAATTRLAQVGVLSAFVICAPPAVIAATFSYSILEHWIGERVTPFWMWQALMFTVPLVNVVVNFGGSILLADRRSTIALNRLAFVQVVLQLGLSLILLRWIEPWSFVLGQVVSVLVVMPLQLSLLKGRLNLSSSIGMRMMGVVGVAAFIAGALYLLEPRPSIPMLLAQSVAGSALAWLAAPWIALDKPGRALFFALLVARLRSFGMLLDKRNSREEGEQPPPPPSKD
ncbi:hypothetical protein Q9K01_13170 [Qipengyuania sp. DY56-A-20]|uniref:Polysaccharide biosynthesis protein n=1 Tax=Qipengyuania benthica TaxID=3067651 RepID=A0ABT9HB79_9SPHN|nr:hypothetical protein [Qipengyuania sp. DY56-A-20]MDP4540577.1 hypothetical protein [Qipengyuania sp. DY56-A-20]